MTERSEDEWKENFTFTYEAGGQKTEMSMSYPDGCSLFEFGGPIEKFLGFLKAAGYPSPLTVTADISGDEIKSEEA